MEVGHLQSLLVTVMSYFQVIKKSFCFQKGERVKNQNQSNGYFKNLIDWSKVRQQFYLNHIIFRLIQSMSKLLKYSNIHVKYSRSLSKSYLVGPIYTRHEMNQK